MEKITLPSGKSAILIVPELVEHLAVVDLQVIKRLAELLPTANVNLIKQNFKRKVDECSTLDEFVAALRDELSFHTSVNLITQIEPMYTTSGGPIAGWGINGQEITNRPAHQHGDTFGGGDEEDRERQTVVPQEQRVY